MQFKLTRDKLGAETDDAVIIVEGSDCIGGYVPKCPGNRHWQMYEAWLAAGNEPLPADPIEAPEET